jgi:hypothetical protein
LNVPQTVTGFVEAVLAVAAAIATLAGAGAAVIGIVRWVRHRYQPKGDIGQTPRLGLQFWQQATLAPMKLGPESPDPVVTVSLARQPFEIWFPNLPEKVALRIATATDPTILSISHGCDLSRTDLTGADQRFSDYFGPGHGGADFEYGGAGLFLDSKDACNYFIGSRVQFAAEGMSKVAVGAWVQNGVRIPIYKNVGDVYLLAFIDSNLNEICDLGELEHLHLRFE